MVVCAQESVEQDVLALSFSKIGAAALDDEPMPEKEVLECLGDLSVTAEEAELLAKLLPEEKRSVHLPEDDLGNGTFSHGRFFGGNFFIASSATGAAKYALTRVVSNNEQVNVIPVAAGTAVNQNFTALALLNNRLPVVARPTIEFADGSKESIYLIKGDGATVLFNTDRLLDATKDPSVVEINDASITALAASHDTIFALVPPNEGVFGNENSGLIRLKEDNGALRVVRLIDGQFGESAAYKIDTAGLDPAERPTYLPKKDSVRFGNIASTLGSQATMWWDTKLERLFIGFRDVTISPARLSNVIFCLVGRIQKGVAGQEELFLEPILTLESDAATKLLFSNQDYGVSFRTGTVAPLESPVGSLFHVRVMHTSTGRSYLVGNGGVSLTEADKQQLNTRVFALPLINSSSMPNDIGAVADTVNHSIRPSTPATVPFVRDLSKVYPDGVQYAREVGADQRYLDRGLFEEATKITDMHVLGDTVYVSLAGPRTEESPGEQGIFSSQALFNAFGEIIAWTPWQRVMGRIEKVFSFGVDQFSQRVFYTTGEDSPTQVKVTQWGEGDGKFFDDGGIHDGVPLSTALDGLSHSNPLFGPVYSLVNFDDETPGFSLTDEFILEFPGFSMMVATGKDKAALVETGAFQLDPNAVFVQTEGFYPQPVEGAPFLQRVFIKSCPGLQDVVTAEVSRIPISTTETEAQKGWLFIGGEGGVAVLSNENGDGWDTSVGKGLAFLGEDVNSDDKSFPGHESWTFKKLNCPGVGDDGTFPDTRKLVSDGEFLYIVTKNKVWRIKLTHEMSSVGFKGGNLTPVHGCIEIANLQSTGLDLVTGAIQPFVDAEFVDMMVLNKTQDRRELLLMTTKGLWVTSVHLSDNGTAGGVEPIQGLKWFQVLQGNVVGSEFFGENRGSVFGSVNKAKSANLVHGNLYVTVIDDQDQVYVHRFRLFDDNGADIQPIQEPYFLGKMSSTTRTPYFYRVGAIRSSRAASRFRPNIKEFTTCAVSGVPVTPDPAYFLQANKDNSAIDLGLQLTRNTCYLPVTRDTASGAQYLAGAFGVRVNE